MVRTTGDVAASSPRERSLAGVLRKAWEKSGISMRVLAKQYDVSHSTLSRWLNGETVPTAEQVSGFLALIGVVGAEREKILDLARGGGAGRTWVTAGPAGVSQQLVGVMEMERTAKAMFQWSPLLIPGLVQAPAYARSIIASDRGLSSTQVEHLLTLRLGRQHAILRDDPIHLTVVVGEPAIRGGIGGSEVMAEQLRYLVKVSERPAVTLQVARVDGLFNGGLLGGFTLYDFEHGLPTIVALEHHRTGSFVDGADGTGDVEDYQGLVRELREIALNPDESRTLINEQIATLEKTR